MNIRVHQKQQSGIALIMVLIVVTVLTIMAGKFAYEMKVETKLARNASFEADYEWAGRSGIEFAKWVLGLSAMGPGAQKDSLGAKWAGGSGDTNGPLADVSLKGIQLSENVFIDLEIEDHDRRFNINVADEVMIKEALTKVVGVEEGTLADTISQSILDWIDPDDNARNAGAESSHYENMVPAYFCKNGPMDDISELLMIQGVNEAMFHGSGGGYAPRIHQMNRNARQSRFEEVTYSVGLKKLFTTTSSKRVNINTAPKEVLLMFPFITDDNIAQTIVDRRNGADQIQGTEDDGVVDPGALLTTIPGIKPQLAQEYGKFFSVRSIVFEVKVDVTAGGMKRRYIGLLRRNSPRDFQLLNMYWQ